MKKQLFVLLCYFTGNFAMQSEFTMPDASVLIRRLKAFRLEDFNKQTNLANKLGNKTLTPIYFMYKFNEAVDSYQGNTINIDLIKRKQVIVKSLLSENISAYSTLLSEHMIEEFKQEKPAN